VLGGTCASTYDCASGFCVDGVCCESACTAQCSACDVPGKLGTCAEVTGTPPHSFRTPCTAPQFLCSAGACTKTCAKDDECHPEDYCGPALECIPRKAVGSVCARKGECPGDRCVDGYCCTEECGSQCEACNVVGFVGQCVAVVGAPVGDRPPCPTVAGDPCATRVCTGKAIASCEGFVGPEVRCRTASCKQSARTSEARCNGAGACPAPDTAACPGFFACAEDALTCRTGCTTSAECAAGYECASNKCVPIPEHSCTDDGAVSVAKDGTRVRCAPYRCKTDGTCATGACQSASDCVSGYQCSSAGLCEIPNEAKPGSGCAFGATSSERSPLLFLLFGLVGRWRKRR
jgi:hypothetical protein